jgi:glyoxylase-like metal-dependent hydrolase (beta-lactamase superfamily II)
MTGIPFVREMDFAYGRMDALSPFIRRLIARNPGPFTFTGTGTYIVGQGEVAVIDPGPLLDDHLEALLDALAGETVSHILITHTHMDHSPLAARLRARTGAPTFAFGPHGAGRAATEVKVEEGGDRDFRPDHKVRDGDVIEGKGWTMECVYTPGHTSNHMSFALQQERALFTGDHVMGWSTSVVAPPDGDMGAYIASLRKLLERDDAVLWPAHGPPVRDPKPFVKAFIAHRQAREEQILRCLKDGIGRIPEMVAVMYRDVDPRLHPAAALSVHAHLVHMVETGRAACEGPPEFHSEYRLP